MKELQEYNGLSPAQFNTLIKNGIAKVLTVSAAKELKGKRIAWTYHGYELNEQQVYVSSVGDILDAVELAERDTSIKSFPNRAEEWKSWMSEKKFNEMKGELHLLDTDGDSTYMVAYTANDWAGIYNEPTFTCSDADREVYFIVLN